MSMGMATPGGSQGGVASSLLSPGVFRNVDEILSICKELEAAGGIIPAITLLEAVAKRYSSPCR